MSRLSLPLAGEEGFAADGDEAGGQEGAERGCVARRDLGPDVGSGRDERASRCRETSARTGAAVLVRHFDSTLMPPRQTTSDQHESAQLVGVHANVVAELQSPPDPRMLPIRHLNKPVANAFWRSAWGGAGGEEHEVDGVDLAAGLGGEGGQERRVERSGQITGRELTRHPVRVDIGRHDDVTGEPEHARVPRGRRRDHRDAEIGLGEDTVLDGTENVSEGGHPGDPSAAGGSAAVREPQRVRADGLPDRVTIYEVGPRDGLQNEDAIVDVEVKAEFIHRLAAAGLTTIETTSFVHPKWVPQLADAAELLTRIDLPSGTRAPVLVPNERGLDRALAAGVAEIAIFASATETFAKKNLNSSLDEQFTMFEPVVRRALDAGLAVRGYVSMCYGDPWEGDVPIDQVVAVGTRLIDLGCHELSLGDTIGVATPGHVEAMIDALGNAGIDVARLAVHFHDTYGQALANTLTALRKGITVIDSSAGGLGGCPYAESATGNLATEDLVWQLDGLGINTGVDLAKLVETSIWMAAKLGRPSASRVVQALAG